MRPADPICMRCALADADRPVRCVMLSALRVGRPDASPA